MGNQRQILKGNIEKELLTKIEAAKDVLDQLNKSLEVSKQDCVATKEEIADATVLLQQMLQQRKKELVKEVDALHHAQVRPLQESIKSTYITVGRLQSMLANLESFDQSQLVNIRIPEVDRSFTLTEPAQIALSLECDNLKEELRDWGNVSFDGFQCYMMDIPENLGQTHERQPSSVSESEINGQDITPDNNEQQAPQKETESRKIPTVENLQMNWSVENWLSKKMSLTISEDDKDDFLIVSPSSDDMTFVDPLQDIDGNSIKLNDSVHMKEVDPTAVSDDGESGSSIVCIERDPQTPEKEDLSIWLKPKKAKLEKQPSEEQQIPQYTPPIVFPFSMMPEQVNKKMTLSSSSSAEKRILDFPCLQMDNENWIRKKRSKSSSLASSICSDKTNTFLQSQQQQNLVPPAYALPNPFWLKKYQIRC